MLELRLHKNLKIPNSQKQQIDLLLKIDRETRIYLLIAEEGRDLVLTIKNLKDQTKVRKLTVRNLKMEKQMVRY